MRVVVLGSEETCVAWVLVDPGVEERTLVSVCLLGLNRCVWVGKAVVCACFRLSNGVD